MVDPAYGVGELEGHRRSRWNDLSGVLVTHYHPDHCGGDMMGMKIEVSELLAETCAGPRAGCGDRVDPQGHELKRRLVIPSGDVVTVGEIDVEPVAHPRSHAGEPVLLVDGRLVAGDTLFLQGCGRTDLPGGDPEALYQSLTGTPVEGARLSGAVSRPPLFPQALPEHG
ncbi:MAG: MBL fold metallo-hydrolase [Microthrixaceae bacterium]